MSKLDRIGIQFYFLTGNLDLNRCEQADLVILLLFRELISGVPGGSLKSTKEPLFELIRSPSFSMLFFSAAFLLTEIGMLLFKL